MAYSFQLPFKIEDPEELHRIARTLYQAARARPDTSAVSRKATTYVPVDLRFSIEDQLDEHRKTLQNMQKYLLALSGRKGVFKGEHDTSRNRFLCHVFSTYGRLNSKQIARLVFPKEKIKPAAVKVRNELKIVRRQLRDRASLGV